MEQCALERAPPGEKVNLDFRSLPVFYDTDDPDGAMSLAEANRKRALAQQRRNQRIVVFEATGTLDVGGSVPPDGLEEVMRGLETLAVTQEPKKPTRVTSHET
ncbi:hypothetical protein TWF718_005875 [Orbilia javanica]|uniref:Uncharacterized protein n=1 Tax=Orbilia javanica TaxID=47235 RepID=A0AAN8REI4_9PEZI